jgi:hypothetical protein
MQAVLLCGGYGVGKSTICVELADLLEERDAAFAAIDLDWLSWARVGDGERADEVAMLVTNLRSVVANYRAAGVRFLVLAWAARDRGELAAVRAALDMPLRVVELDLPIDEVRSRLGRVVTSGRQHDLEVAIQWRREGVGTGFADVIVHNRGGPRGVAEAVFAVLGWDLGGSTSG